MKHLTLEQRYEIKAYLKCNKSKSFIAKEIGVSKSTIYREIKRNSTKTGKYNPKFAEELYEERKERFSLERKFTKEIERLVNMYLKEEQWSPEQIVGYCKVNNIKMVSHERIYQYIRQDKEKGGDLYKYTRHQLKHRKRHIGKQKISIKNKVSIDERPDEVKENKTFGHWEMDTIVGMNNKGAILTLTERTTNFIIMKKLPKGKNAKELAKMIVKLLLPYKNNVLSITTDNGTEFAEHEFITKRIGANIYFAHPYCSWEKGLIEYSNKLIRQYIKKKSNLDEYNDKYIYEIQKKINKRPRKKLNFKKPTEIFFNLVA